MGEGREVGYGVKGGRRESGSREVGMRVEGMGNRVYYCRKDRGREEEGEGREWREGGREGGNGEWG